MPKKRKTNNKKMHDDFNEAEKIKPKARHVEISSYNPI